MVASYDIGEPVRSYVLVPGTGKEKGTRPLCLDLARTSTVAGSVTVPLTIPSTIPSTTPVTNTKDGKEDEKSGGKLASKSDEKVASENQARDTECATRNRDASQTSSSTTPDAPNTQQARSVTHEVARDVSGTKRRLQVDGEDGKESNVPSKIIKTEVQGVKLKSGSSMSIRPPDQEVNELRRKCAELEKQNSNLNRRLAMFHDLFRSKERLVSFVKTLETFSEGKASKSNGV